jgi:6-phosphogluconolactonase
MMLHVHPMLKCWRDFSPFLGLILFGCSDNATSSPMGTIGSSSTVAGAGGFAGSSAGAGGATGTAGNASTTGAAGTSDAGPGSGGRGGSNGTGGNGGSADGGTGPRATYVFVSGYGGSIATFVFDPASGSLTPRGTPARVASASFLAWNSPARQLYALSEVSAGRIFAFSVNGSTGALTPINDAASGGAGPAHLLVDPSGKWVLVANYGGGTAAVLPVQSNGGVNAPAAADVQSFGNDSLPHEVAIDPSGQFAFIPLKGANAIAQFRFDGTSGKLTANTPARVTTAVGAGPRHMAFHSSGKFAYVINEQASTMVAYTLDTMGRLTEMQSLTTRPASSGDNATAEAAVHPSGKWLYGSNRGDNDIVQYSLGDTDGMMTLVGHTPSGGNNPGHFSMDPTGQFMFVANRDSDNVVVFRIGADGKMQQTGNPVSVTGATPTFVGAALVP